MELRDDVAGEWILDPVHMGLAQRIGRARAETKAALDAVTDNASPYFLRRQIERILEALQ